MTVCIVVNGEKFQSQAVTLTLIGQCPMSNSSELFSYTTICSSFKWIEPLFYELSCTETDTHTQTPKQTDRYQDTQMDTSILYLRLNKTATIKMENISCLNVFVTFKASPYVQWGMCISHLQNLTVTGS